MKKVVIPGLIIGVLILIVSMAINYLMNLVLPSLQAEYQGSGMFRPWSDPLMQIYFAYPFIVGLVLAWLWDKVKGLLSGGMWSKVLQLTWGYFLVATLPGMFITYSSFNISLGMVLSWTVMGVINVIIAGLVLSKMNA